MKLTKKNWIDKVDNFVKKTYSLIGVGINLYKLMKEMFP